jgi:hypothetical protein
MFGDEKIVCPRLRLFALRFAAPLDVSQHGLPQNTVHPRLIPLAALLQPGNHIGIEPHRDGLPHRTIEPASNRVFPRAGRKLRDIRSIDLVVGQGGQSRRLSFLF